MLIIGIIVLIISRIIINKEEIFFRLSLGIILYSLILSSQSWIIKESDLGILGGLFHINNLINGIEIYIYLISILLISCNSRIKIISSEYYIIILFSLLGMILLICSYDLISIFLSIELQSLSLYIITTITKKEAIVAGLKYYLLGSLSSAILLLGLVLIYIITGVTQYDSLFLLLNISSDINISYSFFIYLSIIMIMVGLLFKIGAAPFHNWAPDVYDGVPTIITSWIAIMGKISILVFICLSQSILFNNTWSDNMNNNIINIFEIILAISTFLSLVIGSTLGLVQHRIKRLLAYSSISHLGFILLALTAYQQSWVITSLITFLFYMFQYWISLICTFAIIIFLGRDLQYISFLKGLFYFNPLITLALIINLFSLAGIPPLIGFFGKQMVLYTSLLNGYYLLSIIAILTSVISAVYYLKIIKTTIFDNSYNNKYTIQDYNNNNLNLSLTSWIISFISLVSLLYFMNPIIILDFIHLLALSIDS